MCSTRCGCTCHLSVVDTVIGASQTAAACSGVDGTGQLTKDETLLHKQSVSRFVPLPRRSGDAQLDPINN